MKGVLEDDDEAVARVGDESSANRAAFLDSRSMIWH